MTAYRAAVGLPTALALPRTLVILLAASLSAVLSGCEGRQTPTSGQPADTPAPPAVMADTGPPRESDNATSKDFGDHVLYFNALRTSELTPEIAKAYDIVRSPNRVMLNVSLSKKVPGTPGEPVAATVNVETVNLNGQFKNLTVREVREGTAIYYIGDVPVADDETLVFTVDVVPVNDTRKYEVRFAREFM